ncbi:MAG: iron-sulfur cluster assembly accessory protein, partial [Candidatus Poseidoniaceae archaeon]|nr:iron-sulfur cluster assembly accessory protein [Candidatus Poseidoniaceae archaeon]
SRERGASYQSQRANRLYLWYNIIMENTEQLIDIVDNETGDMVLKIAVHRGGCSGNLYDLELVDRPEGGGFQFDEVNGIHIAVSDYDSSLLSGIVIDFQDSLMGGGFKINNPNAQKECGCGKSFA